MILEQILLVITTQFNDLKEIEDWEFLYAVLTSNLDEDKEWTNDFVPCNLDDLFWKTKVRFLSMHNVGFADLEGQKRTCSFSCALMGIVPRQTIAEFKVREEDCRVTAKRNPARRTDIRSKPRKLSVLHNQSRKFTLTVGMLSLGEGEVSLEGAVKTFYNEFSSKKANAASRAQENSWKEIALKMCSQEDLKDALIPYDFKKTYFEDQEDLPGAIAQTDATEKAYKLSLDKGSYIKQWAKDCRSAIVQQIFRLRSVPALAQVLPAQKKNELLPEFTAALLEKLNKRTTAIWSLPHKVPAPKAVNTLIYSIFLIGPASACIEDNHTGLKRLVKVINSDGTGVQDNTFWRDRPDDCYVFEPPTDGPFYKQTVSKNYHLQP
jgi:hypothetical protein